MSYKTVAVHLTDEHRLPGVLGAALRIARSEGAHLIGLAVIPPIIVVPGSEGMAGDVIEEHRDVYRQELGRMRKAFAEATAGPDVSAEWREIDCETDNPFGDVGTVALKHMRSADLVVASQANPGWAFSGALDVAETLILNSGRPVLMLPRSAGATESGRRILVAWNARREAARAVFDALPLLKSADEVKITWVDPESERRAAGDLPGAEIAETLARHGVRCETVAAAGDARNVGAALLATTKAQSCDMLVMGCYGHSRLREMVFGGASRHVLAHMATPVLLSH